MLTKSEFEDIESIHKDGHGIGTEWTQALIDDHQKLMAESDTSTTELLNAADKITRQTQELDRLSRILGRTLAICSAFCGEEIKNLPDWIDGRLVELMECREKLRNTVAPRKEEVVKIWDAKDAQIRFFVTLGETEQYGITRQEFFDLASIPERLRFGKIYEKVQARLQLSELKVEKLTADAEHKDRQIKMLCDSTAMLTNAVNADLQLHAQIKALTEENERLKKLSEMRGKERDVLLAQRDIAFDIQAEADNKLSDWRMFYANLVSELHQLIDRHSLTAVPDKRQMVDDNSNQSNTGWRNAWPDTPGWWWSFWPGRKKPELSLWDQTMIAYYTGIAFENNRFYKPVLVPENPKVNP